MNRIVTSLVSGVVLAMLLAGSAFAGSTVLYFKSEPGDYIGGGVESFFASGEYNFYASSNFYNGISLLVNNYSSPDPMNHHWWSMDFSAPYNAPLLPGAYETAARSPFQLPSQPGLSIYGDGRGCNTLTGRFDVLEADYAPGGEVVKFAANFEQHCEGGTPALYGEVRFNSDIPISVLIPAKITVENPLNFANCVEATGPDGALVAVTGLESRDSQGGTNLSYSWETSNGTTSNEPSFQFPVGLNQTVEVRLTIEDLATGDTSTAARSVCVSDTTPPQIIILSPQAGETLVGNQIKAEVAVTDVVDKNIGTFDLFLGANGTFKLNPDKASTKIHLLQGQNDSAAIPMELRVSAHDASGNYGEQSVNVFRVHDLGQKGK